MTTPDNSPVPVPPVGGPKKPRKPRGPLDAATLDQLEKDEEIVLAVKARMATDAPFVSNLAPHFLDAANTVAITPASVNTLASQASDARATAAAAMSGTASREEITGQEETDKTDLLASIQNAKTRAKGKYQQSAPAKLKEYWIGENLLLGRRSSRPVTEFTPCSAPRTTPITRSRRRTRSPASTRPPSICSRRASTPTPASRQNKPSPKVAPAALG